MDCISGTSILIAVGLLLGIYVDITVQEDYYGETGNVFSTVFHKYNANFRPYKAGKESTVLAVPISTNMTFIKLVKFDREAMEMESIVDLRVKWKDSRLYWFSDIIQYLTVNSTEVWTPDVAFLNADFPPVILNNPRYLIVLKSGEVFWYRRFKIITACTLTNESDDAITCPVTIGSFQFSANEQEFSSMNCISDSIDFSADTSYKNTSTTTYMGTNITTYNATSENITDIPVVDMGRRYVILGSMNITEFYSQIEEKTVYEIPFKDNKISQASCVLKFSAVSDEIEPQTKLPFIQTTNHSVRNLYDVAMLLIVLMFNIVYL